MPAVHFLMHWRDGKVVAQGYPWRVDGDGLGNHGVNSGDFLAVDPSLEPRLGDYVIADVGGSFSCRKIIRIGIKLGLSGDEEESKVLLKDASVRIKGVVTKSFRQF